MLELKNINYSINGKNILNNINLKFDDKKIVVITGANGSGKSTLVKLIMGLIQPTSGQVFFDGKDITNFSINERAEIGFAIAFQQPIKFKGITVGKLLELAQKGSKDIQKPKLKDYCECLSKVGLCARNYLDREFNSSLSGGELKRIEIAMVLARNVKVNIFDEPEAGIDLWSFDSLLQIFKNLKRKSLCVIITHEEKIINLADDIVVLNNSSIDKFGSKSEVIGILGKKICNKLKRGK